MTTKDLIDVQKVDCAESSTEPPNDRNLWVEHYSYLVNKVASKMIARLPASIELDDLRSAGIVGLIDAVEKYESDKSSQFATYAEIRIRGAIVDELRSQDWVPRSVRRRRASIENTIRQLTEKLGRFPNCCEIASELKISVEEFERIYQQLQTASLVSYEDINSHNEGRHSFLDSVPDLENDDPESLSDKNNVRKVLIRSMQRLSERERIVVSLYYFEDLSLKEIGNLLGVTESRISQIRTKALNELRPILRAALSD